MPRIVIIGMVFLSVAVCVQPADAQGNRLYAGVSGMVSTQGSTEGVGSCCDSAPSPGVSGTAPGVAGEFGTVLPPRMHEWTFSLSFEFSLPARFDSVQETNHYEVYQTDNKYRDLVFSGLFHVHAPPNGPVRLGFVVGPSIIQEDNLQSTTVPIAGVNTGNLGPFGPETQLTIRTVGLTVGADFGIQISRRVQIVPQIRLHWVNRNATDAYSNGFVTLFLGSWLIRPAVGIRVGF
jgi:hypothetical protein